MAKTELMKPEGKELIIPFGEMPDHVKAAGTRGLEGMDQSDFKLPRMLCLDAKSPAVTTFAGEAIPGHFWHTGISKDMGTEYLMVPCTAGKRAVVWLPREMGGGVAAMSRDGVHWSQGANQEITVKLKDVKKQVTWRTGKDVKSSGLLEWGTSNPDDENSPPAAQLSYEYLMWLVEYPELSPIFMGCFRTALANAKQFNTALLALKKPITSVVVRVFAESKKDQGNEWAVPNFQLKGWAPIGVAEKAAKIAEASSAYVNANNPEYDEEAANTVKGNTNF